MMHKLTTLLITATTLFALALFTSNTLADTDSSTILSAAAKAATLEALKQNDEVANKKQTIKDRYKAQPPGWNKGKKVGWQGENIPPGQAKKLDSNKDKSPTINQLIDSAFKKKD